jgi:integrase
MAKLLTPLAVKNAKPKRHNGQPVLTEISDSGARGLRLCVHPTGRKVWICRYRVGTRSRKLTLGPVTVLDKGEDPGEFVLTLSAARKAAAEALHKVERGIDPAAEKAEAAKPAAAAETFEAVATKCFNRASKKLRSAPRSLHDLRRLAFPTLGSQPIASIKRSDVVRLLDHIEDNSGPIAADATLAAISKVMNWHATRSDDFVPPLVRGMRRTNAKERARDRILSDEELRAVWTTASDSEGLFGLFVQFLLLTACRRNEAAHMRWPEVADGLWTLPAARNKTKKELARPLSTAAQTVLAKIPRAADSDLVFFAGGHWLFNNLAALKRKLDKQSGVTGWRLHDLRRTARSLLSRAKVDADHAERVLGHVIPGVRGTYDRHEYKAEILQAYEKLAALIEGITNPKQNVVPLRG